MPADSEYNHSAFGYRGNSIYEHDPKGKVAFAYTALTKEVMSGEEK